VSRWPEVTLGELCHVARGGSPRPIKSFLTDDPAGINWIKIADASAGDGKFIASTQEKIRPEGLKMSRLVKPGDFLLSNSMSFGRPYIMRTTGCIHDGWLVLSDRSNRFDPDYLYYFLGSDAAYRQFDALAAGSTVRNLNTDLVKTVKVVLPPLEEQRRIVAVLDEAFAAIATATANAEKNLANARELFEATLRDALDDGASPWTTLGQATDIKVGFAFKSTGYSSSDDDIPLIRGDNVVQGRLRWEDVKRWPRSAADDYTAYSLAVGDVLLAMDRTWVKAGLKYAVIGSEDVPSLLVQRVARLRAGDATSSEFIALQIAAPAFTEYVLGIQTGLGVPHISGKQIADYRFRLPPRAKQLELIERLNAVRRASSQLVGSYSAKLKALQNLRESLLNRAFSGELTEREPLAA
jgi:type I restriction enzyme S subunit